MILLAIDCAASLCAACVYEMDTATERGRAVDARDAVERGHLGQFAVEQLADEHARLGVLPQHEGGPLTLLAGPQRLEAGWLDGDAHCALRDYYVARSAVAGLVWLYCERLSGQACWYLHGLYA